MHIRKACPTDIHIVFELANDPLVRAMSFISDPIPWETHLGWYAKILDNPQEFLLLGFEQIGTNYESFIGQVRFTLVEGNLAETGISLTPFWRNKGRAQSLLTMGIAWLNAKIPTIQIKALIKPDNPRSQKLFMACGFKPHTMNNQFLELRYANKEGDSQQW